MSESLINFFRKNCLRKDFCIYYNVDYDNELGYSPIYEANNGYKFYIPLDVPIDGFKRIVVSENAARYIENNLGNLELRRLRISFYPWPEMVLMSKENFKNRIHEELDSIKDVCIRFEIKGDNMYHNNVPTYKILNFLGIKQCMNYHKEYPQRYNLNVMTRVNMLLDRLDRNVIPQEAILFKRRKELLGYKIGNAKFKYDLSKLQLNEIPSFIEGLSKQDLMWLEEHKFQIVADFSGSCSGVPFLMYKIILAENTNDERVVLYRSGITNTRMSMMVEKRALSAFPEIGEVWEQQDGHDYWGSIKKVFKELGDRFTPELMI